MYAAATDASSSFGLLVCSFLFKRLSATVSVKLKFQHVDMSVDNSFMSSREAMGFKAHSGMPGSSSQPSPAAMAAKQGYAAETRRPILKQQPTVNLQRCDEM